MKNKLKVFWDKYGDKIAEAAGFFAGIGVTILISML